jgi:trans-AT polyketide synthase/acyltransferase/oxidoreductase domain-containing protein
MIIKAALPHDTSLSSDLKEVAPAAVSPAKVRAEPLIAASPGTLEPPARQAGISATSLGSRHFKADYQVQYAYAYVAGAMVHGIASAVMVIRMGRAGMLSFFGSGGLAPSAVEQAIVQIQQALQPGQPYGANLLNGSHEEANVALFLKHGVRNTGASAYLQMTSGLVRYRLCGLKRAGDGSVLARNRIMAKLSRPEIAAAFLHPAPERIVRRLREQGLVSAQQAEWSTQVPMADDICVEADSGGHTDRGVAATLLPAIQRQRDAAMAAHAYRKPIRVGCAGGIGIPEAVAAAFVLGVDFILTGSINQCTVEAGSSELVKDRLQEMQVQDTDYAPAGDMFEIGARVQVLKRGLFFPVRANKLYELYRSVDSIEQIDPGTARMIQEKYFQRSLAEVYGTADAVSATLPPGSDRRTRSAQWPWHRADRRTRCPGGIPRTHPAIVSESLHQSPSAPRFL